MLSHLSLLRTGKSVIDQQSWKCHLWLKYMCALVHEKYLQWSDLSKAGNSCEGTKSYSSQKHLVYSQTYANYKDLFYQLSHTVTVISSESHIDYYPVIMKQQFCPHAGRHFLAHVLSLQQPMCQKSVLSCVRSFHTCRNKQSLANDVLTDTGAKKEAMPDKVLTKNMVAEINNVCGTIAPQQNELSPNYLKMLANLLYCSVDEMKNLVTMYSFFSHLSPELITTKVNIMLQFGLPHTFVSKHPRLLFQSSAEQLQRRLQKLKDHSFLTENSVVTLDNLPHYLECKNSHFNHIFKRLCAEKDSLEGCFDQQAYIQFRLKCSKVTAWQILSSYPLNRRFSNVRMKKVLDFLLNEAQLSAQFVTVHLRLMMFSVDRLRARWKAYQLESIKSEATFKYIFALTQKEFENIYGDCPEKLKKE